MQLDIQTTSEEKKIKDKNITEIFSEETSDSIWECSNDMEGENWIFNPKKEDWDSYIERL